jgi:hypothetical protein
MTRLLPDWWIVIAMGYWEWTIFKRTDTAQRVLLTPVHNMWIKFR